MRLMGDFETTTNKDDCRVWASCICNIDRIEEIYTNPSIKNEIVKTWNNIESCMDYLANLPKSHELYFHNLKFDGKFIISWLLKNGFTFDDDLDSEKTFNTLITDTNIFYAIEICWSIKEERRKSKIKKIKHTTKIYDSSKKIPLPVRAIPKAYGLPNAKLEIDYKGDRPIGHILTQEEIDYVEEDCIIVARALKQMFEDGMEKMTMSSDALNNFKTLHANGNEKFKQTVFRNTFPLLDNEIDEFVRKSYKGGYTFVKPSEANKIHGEGIVYDVNSLYPSVMYNKPLPWGIPRYFKGFYYDNYFLFSEYPLFIQRFTCRFKCKKDRLPTVQIKNNFRFSETEYLYECEDVVELTMTSVDFDLFTDHYDIYDYEFIDGYAFRERSNTFKKYIDYWGEIKAKSTGGKRTLAKLMLNSLYGKFATNPKSIVKVPFLDESGVVKYFSVEQEDRESCYTPLGSFVTAYAREITIRTAQSVYDRFIYCDTDSIHLKGHEIPNINIHPTELGAWKCEGLFKKAKFLRAKTYMEEYICKDGGIIDTPNDLHLANGKTHIDVKCAGMPDKSKSFVTFENFKQGSSYEGKLRPVTVNGGVVLEEILFTIK